MLRRIVEAKNEETLTIGDCLRRERENRRMSIKEIGDRLGIKVAFLESLESGDYENLPPHVYVKGFLKSYASFLGIDPDQATKMYDREVTFLERDYLREKRPKINKLRLRNFIVVTPKIITIISSLFVFSILSYYLYHQLNSFNSKPYLFLENPTGDEVVYDEGFRFNGYTEEGAVLKINGQEVAIASDGYFDQYIVLSEGINVFTVEVKNRFDKVEKREINIIYKKEESDLGGIQEVTQ